MNNYVTINGKQYRASELVQDRLKAVTARKTVFNVTDVTYAEIDMLSWKGVLEAEAGVSAPWGTPQELEHVIMAATPITFVDHYGVTRTANIIGQPRESSFGPVLSDTIIQFDVEIVA